MRDYILYLKDILQAMEAIETFVVGINFDSFKKNDLISSAVVRKFEIIGEAAKHIPETMRNSHPEIPWKEMAGMRDKLIHFYFGTEYNLVWHTITDVIPKVKPLIHKVLAERAQSE
ncbi:MAG: DUF86 domain-containing protein [Deltaproteobacteria bacterium]|nr:DUF86 domain-containing protein [Deltaproteobacteria bacterium]MBF0525760.1 DUF86 domain-containing protein [Deltaproteobacteria bacterium]